MWFSTCRAPFTLPLEPVGFEDPSFETLLVKTKLYAKVESYLKNINLQKGKFWIESSGSGYGKSTVLHYIARYLYRKLNELRTLPLHIQVAGKRKDLTILEEFEKEVIGEIWDLSARLERMQGVLSVEYESDILDLVEELKRKHPQAVKEKKVPENPEWLSGTEIREWFYKALNRLQEEVVKEGRFKGFALLIDEIDKLSQNEISEFLGRNQELFQDLYSKYNFVVFFAGQKSWVDQIHEGSEYTFYRGERFELTPFIDPDDIKRLIDSRLEQFAHIREQDNPWTSEAFEALRELTRGVPREMIRLASVITSQAAEKRKNKIGKGFVKDVFQNTQVNKAKLIEYLQDNYKTYLRVRKACESSGFPLIPIFHSMEGGIPIEHDKDLSWRTRYYGVEDSDEQWQRRVNDLVFAQCLVVQADHKQRRLEPGVRSFIDFVKDQLNINPGYVPDLLRELKVEPKKGKLEEPDYREALGRPFKISPEKWWAEEEVFSKFLDTTDVEYYLKKRFGEDKFIDKGREIFGKEFRNFVESNRLMAKERNGVEHYRLLPERLLEKELLDKISRFASIEVIDILVEISSEEGSVNATELFEKCDKLIELLTAGLLEIRRMPIKRTGYIRESVAREEILGVASAGSETLEHIDDYIRETSRSTPRIRLIRELTIAIFHDFCGEYQRILEARESMVEGITTEAYFRELVSKFDGREIDGKRIGIDKPITLYHYDSVERKEVSIGERITDLDIVAYRRFRDRKHFLFGEVKKGPAKSSDIRDFVSIAEAFLAKENEAAKALGEPVSEVDGKWFVCMGSAPADVCTEARSIGVLVLNKDGINFLLKEFSMNRLP